MIKRDVPWLGSEGETSGGVVVTTGQQGVFKLFFSHQIAGFDFKRDGEKIEGDLQSQTAQSLRTVKDCLDQVGGGIGQIVKMTIFVKDPGLAADVWPATEDICGAIQKFFCFERPGNMILPAQGIVFVSRLPFDHLGQLVGIEAMAIVN